jgi:RNA polymerase sigma factor (sigma-70 family)
MGENSKYDELIEKVIYKYARRIPWQDKEDLRQEANLALFVNREKINSPRLAYIIIRNTIIDSLRIRPPNTEDISDPGVVKKIDRQQIRQPSVDILIDATKAIECLNSLSSLHQFILESFFGLGGTTRHTETEIGELYGKDRYWVHREKEKALKELKEMMA